MPTMHDFECCSGLGLLSSFSIISSSFFDACQLDVGECWLMLTLLFHFKEATQLLCTLVRQPGRTYAQFLVVRTLIDTINRPKLGNGWHPFILPNLTTRSWQLQFAYKWAASIGLQHNRVD